MLKHHHPKSRYSIYLADTALALVVILTTYGAINHVAPVKNASTWLDDFRLAYLTPLEAQSSDVVILAINEDTLARMPYRSPIDREFIAQTIEKLTKQYNLRAIGVDLIFDQPTVAENDRFLQATLLNSSVPLIVAVGEASAGLSDSQLAFQTQFLEDVQNGSAVLSVEGGVVRNHYPYSPTGQTISFVNAVAVAAGLDPPADPMTILFRRGALGNTRAVRVFPAHNVDVLPAEWLNDKIVLLGADLSDRDQHRTPFSILGGEHEFMAGVMIHAQVLAQISTGATYPVLSEWSSNGYLALAVVLGLILALSRIPARLRFLLGLLIFVSYWIAAFSSSIFWQVPLPILGPSIGFVLATSAATAIARQQERRRRKFLHSAFNQYVSSEIIDNILADPRNLRLGGESREMSFIFTDIAGFSTLAERASPDDVVQLLSGYLDGLVEIALDNKGTIARFAGDGLLVFFGAPVLQDEHARNAIECAVEFDQFCEQYRQGDQQHAHGFGVTRIGVHSGRAIVGNVGGSRRFEYTAHGDCVNTAARLESANRHFSSRVCISRDTVDGSPLSDFRPIGDVILKGKTKSLSLLTVWDSFQDADRNDYLRVYELLRQSDPRCEREFTQLAERLPNDGLIAFHLSRLRAGESGVEFRLQEK
jgi:class 3 adenylate cyclase/CHASE2 domain-containing sensor protein